MRAPCHVSLPRSVVILFVRWILRQSLCAITTCNGGDGSDWNVIQNWSGTYGGDIYKYGYELSRPNQLLNGEYGAWRSIDLHTEPAAFDAKGIWSEERMCLLMELRYVRQRV